MEILIRGSIWCYLCLKYCGFWKKISLHVRCAVCFLIFLKSVNKCEILQLLDKDRSYLSTFWNWPGPVTQTLTKCICVSLQSQTGPPSCRTAQENLENDVFRSSGTPTALMPVDVYQRASTSLNLGMQPFTRRIGEEPNSEGASVSHPAN